MARWIDSRQANQTAFVVVVHNYEYAELPTLRCLGRPGEDLVYVGVGDLELLRRPAKVPSGGALQHRRLQPEMHLVRGSVELPLGVSRVVTFDAHGRSLSGERVNRRWRH